MEKIIDNYVLDCNQKHLLEISGIDEESIKKIQTMAMEIASSMGYGSESVFWELVTFAINTPGGEIGNRVSFQGPKNIKDVVNEIIEEQKEIPTLKDKNINYRSKKDEYGVYRKRKYR